MGGNDRSISAAGHLRPTIIRRELQFPRFCSINWVCFKSLCQIPHKGIRGGIPQPNRYSTCVALCCIAGALLGSVASAADLKPNQTRVLADLPGWESINNSLPFEEIRFLDMAAIQTELQVSDSVIEAIKGLDRTGAVRELRKKWPRTALDTRGDAPEAQRRPAHLAAVAPIEQKTRGLYSDLLTKEQRKRLRQVVYQYQGLAAFSHEEVRSSLRLSELQLRKIGEANFDFVINLGRPWQRAERTRQQRLQDYVAKVIGILADDQLAIWNDLAGQKFDFTKLLTSTPSSLVMCDKVYILALSAKSVQGELAMSQSQVEKTEAALEDAKRLVREAFPGRTDRTPSEQCGAERSLHEAMRRLHDGILTEAQQKRLEQIVLQLDGVQYVLYDDWLKLKLQVTLQQEKEFRGIYRELSDKKIKELSKNSNSAERAKARTEVTTEFLEAINRKLEPQQKGAWKDLVGEVFTIER